MPMSTRLTITFLYTLSVLLAYCIMLAVMTYNGGVCITAIVGLTVGDLFYSLVKDRSYAVGRSEVG